MKTEADRHSLQTIMSRTGSFPLKVALDILQEYGNNNSVIFDPFCGKGTTLLAARMLGFPTYGMDVAPEAVICSAAKMADVDFDSVHDFIKRLKYRKAMSLKNIPSPVRVFFHPDTLCQIIGIRNALTKNFNDKDKYIREHSVFCMAILLGILHGHASYSLSISSAHAFAMAPNYVKKYAKEHDLRPPIQNVKACMIKKAGRLFKDEIPKCIKYDVLRGTALSCSSLHPNIKGKVDIVLTSPPYLNAQTYAKDNWLRLWLLGYNHKEIQNEYIQTGSPQKYIEYMKQVFNQIHDMIKPNGHFICIAGDVRTNCSSGNGKKMFKTGIHLSNICNDSSLGLSLVDSNTQIVSNNCRYFNSLCNSTGHKKRKLVERIFVAKKIV